MHLYTSSPNRTFVLTYKTIGKMLKYVHIAAILESMMDTMDYRIILNISYSNRIETPSLELTIYVSHSMWMPLIGSIFIAKVVYTILTFSIWQT